MFPQMGWQGRAVCLTNEPMHKSVFFKYPILQNYVCKADIRSREKYNTALCPQLQKKKEKSL